MSPPWPPQGAPWGGHDGDTMTHISTAKLACTPTEGDIYLVATRDGMFVPQYHGLYICNTPIHICTIIIIVKAYSMTKNLKQNNW